MVTTPDVQLTKPWTAALFGFRLDLQSRRRSEGTISNRLCSTTIMAKHAISAGLDDPAEVDYPWLAQYMSAQYKVRKRGGPGSLYADLRAFWTWYAEEFKSASPMEKIRRPRAVMTDVPTLNPGQIEALKQATAGTDAESVRNRAVMLVLLDSGLRRMELSRLDCGDLDLEDCSLGVRRGKGGKARTVLIGTVTAQALWRYLRGRADASAGAPLFLSAYGHRLTPSGVGQLIVRLGKAAGIDGLHPHQFRHTWASMNQVWTTASPSTPSRSWPGGAPLSRSGATAGTSPRNGRSARDGGTCLVTGWENPSGLNRRKEKPGSRAGFFPVSDLAFPDAAAPAVQHRADAERFAGPGQRPATDPLRLARRDHLRHRDPQPVAEQAGRQRRRCLPLGPQARPPT